MRCFWDFWRTLRCRPPSQRSTSTTSLSLGCWNCLIHSTHERETMWRQYFIACTASFSELGPSFVNRSTSFFWGMLSILCYIAKTFGRDGWKFVFSWERESLLWRCNFVFRFIFETERFNGVTELLEILGRYNCLFVLLTLQFHSFLLIYSLTASSMALLSHSKWSTNSFWVVFSFHCTRLVHSASTKHRYQSLHHCAFSFISYFLQLAYCVIQFLEKDPNLTEQVWIG